MWQIQCKYLKSYITETKFKFQIADFWNILRKQRKYFENVQKIDHKFIVLDIYFQYLYMHTNNIYIK